MNSDPFDALDRRLAALRARLEVEEPADLVPGVLRRVRSGSPRLVPVWAVATGLVVSLVVALLHRSRPVAGPQPSSEWREMETLHALIVRARIEARMVAIRRLALASGRPADPGVREACMIALSRAAAHPE